MEYYVVMVWHHAERACVDGEDVCELLDMIDDPLTSVFIAFTGKWIFAAKKGSSNTA
jgi:hypothetical protein